MNELIMFIWVVGAIFTIGVSSALDNGRNKIYINIIVILLCMLLWPFLLAQMVVMVISARRRG